MVRRCERDGRWLRLSVADMRKAQQERTGLATWQRGKPQRACLLGPHPGVIPERARSLCPNLLWSFLDADGWA